jgi:hypothetical protein
MNEQMIPFYLAGRGVKSLSRLKKYVDDPDEIAEKITTGSVTVRGAVGAAADAAAAQLKADKKRRATFLAEYKELLDDLGLAALTGSSDEAWSSYCQGMSDELAYSLEPEVLDALDDDDEGDDDDEEDGDDGDGDDDEEPAKPS